MRRRNRVPAKTPTVPWRPTKEQLLAAKGKRVRDVIKPGLQVLFCGINPGLYSGAVGHHFARPGNRFWKVLYRAGFTGRRILSPFDEQELLPLGIGITNLVSRSTAAAAELTTCELEQGSIVLKRKVCRYRPAVLAFLGIQAYRLAFRERHAVIGSQDRKICGATVWLLPNPSGAQAHYQLADMVRAFVRLRAATMRKSLRKNRRTPEG